VPSRYGDSSKQAVLRQQVADEQYISLLYQVWSGQSNRQRVTLL